MKNLSLLLILLLSSSVVYADWTKYVDRDPSNLPEGACLEMICDYGCVENNETLEGKCCKSKGKKVIFVK